MKVWWNGLNDRERWLIGGGGLLALALLLYVLAWEPFQERLANLRQSVATLRGEVDWMRQAAAELRALQADPERRSVPRGPRPSLLILADQTARRAELGQALKRVEPQGSDKIRVWLEAAPFDGLVTWLGRMQNEHGVRTDNIIVTPRSESGQVDARVILAEGAP